MENRQNGLLERYKLGEYGVFTIGRNASCTLSLDRNEVSRLHARIEKNKESFHLTDMGSTNGTQINGKSAGACVLSNNDIVRIGPFRFLYSAGCLYRMSNENTIRLSARGIRKKLDGKTVLHTTDISFQPGEFVGIFGSSGAGKTTLIKMLSGHYKPDSGSVCLNNVPLGANYNLLKTNIGFVPHEDIVHSVLDISKILRYSARLRMGREADAAERKLRIEKILSLVELTEHRKTKAGRLSGGQRRRVNLAVELLTEPAILFLDEPTSGLDAWLEEKLTGLFKKIADSGKSVIMTTHSIASMDSFDKVAIVHQGRLVFFGPPAECASYFGLKEYKDIYSVLSGSNAGELEKRFKKSPQYKENVGGRLEAEKEEFGDLTTTADYKTVNRWLFRENKPVFSAQLLTLIRRYSAVTLSDAKNFGLLLVQAPLIALMLAIVFKNYSDIWPLAFCMSLSAIWFGSINSVKEITKEKDIYRRERMINLSIPAYVLSKLAVLTIICALQCFILNLIVEGFIGMPGSMFTVFLILLLSASSGATLGLFISAAVSTTDRALSLLPVALIPQILFSGVIVPVDQMMSISRYISSFMICRWSYSALRHYSIWQWSESAAAASGVLALFIPAFTILTLAAQKLKDQKFRE
ncbi:MAG: ATP-binding cassette domain-containing protein [Fibrobacterota bacterium]